MTLPDFDPTDPWVRVAQTFPTLNTEAMERLRSYGKEEHFSSETALFRRGDRGIDFFLVLDGEVSISGEDFRTGRRFLYSYTAGQFTGEQNLFNTRPVLWDGIALPGTRVVRIRNADFRTFLTSEPEIGEVVVRAYILRRTAFIRHASGGVILLGHRESSELLKLQHFLTRNLYPVELLDVDLEEGKSGFMQSLGIDTNDLPVVITPDGRSHKKPSPRELADALGILEPPQPGAVYDVAVVGAGPGGLAAAVYAASEGLNTIVVEVLAPGGQAATSSKIENYLGFPTGISGQALAGRAHFQAQKFGARISVSRAAVSLDCSGPAYKVVLDDGQCVESRAVVVATGARYRRLDLPGYQKYEGEGIHYAATSAEGAICSGQDVVVVGGGNSAGQAAVFLSGKARHVHMLVRRGLSDTMSDYLVQRIERSPRITVHVGSELIALAGDRRLEEVTWRDNASGETTSLPTGNLFVMIGALPNTGWLNGCVDLDDKGFVTTGHLNAADGAGSPYVTSNAGIFAVGDVRAKSIKRVASAVGEGSVVIQAVHGYLTRSARPV